MFSQSGNDSKWLLTKIIFQNAILNFHFDFLNPSLKAGFQTLTYCFLRLLCLIGASLCFYLFTYHSYLLSKVVMLICYRTDSMKLQSLNTFLPDHHSKRKHSREKAGAEIWTTYFCSICPTTISLLRHQQHLVGGFWRKNVAPFMKSSSDLRQLKL